MSGRGLPSPWTVAAPPGGREESTAEGDWYESLAPSGDPYIDGLLLAWDPTNSGTLSAGRWDTLDFTFSFPTLASHFTSSGYVAGWEQDVAFSPATLAQQAAARAVLAMVETFTLLSFTEIQETTSNHAIIRYAQSDLLAQAAGWSWMPGEEGAEIRAGDVWIKSSNPNYDTPLPGNFGWYLILHETAHAIGLVHGHEAFLGFNALPADRDGTEFNVTTYRDVVGGPISGTIPDSYSTTFMMLDIAALQYLYGANYAHNAGDTTYAFSPTTGEMFVDGAGQGAPAFNKIFLTIWDGGGVDTYDFSNYADDMEIDLAPGSWSLFSDDQLTVLDQNTRVEARANVYNALLHDDDPRSLIENAIGGTGDDLILGNQADNMLAGGAGADTLSGWSGFDLLFGGGGNDALNGGLNIDEVHGGDGADTLKGQGGGDNLYGEGGHDFLTGQAGPDTLIGAAGNDTLLGGAGPDTLSAGGGTDHVEGGGGNDVIDGGNDDDTLYGAIGADVIDGGFGDDAIFGGGGGDTLDGGAGRDTIEGGNGDDALSGGGADDVLRGERGDDVLDGGGGADVLIGGVNADVLTGGAGADTFVFTATSDAGNGPTTRDVITDFSRADGDLIDLSAIDADVVAGGDQAFTIVGAFSNTAGELVLTLLSGTTVQAEIDVDGDAKSDMTFEVTGQADLNAGDFVL